jgi:hypothetical protein
MKKLVVKRPILTDYKTQSFGEDKACIYPNKTVVTRMGNAPCPVGSESLYQSLNMLGHNGEDWYLYLNEPVFFPTVAYTADGKEVTWHARREIDDAGGLGVDVFSDEPVLVGGQFTYVKFRFWHLSAFSITDGQSVVPGQQIGKGGSTGLSSGPHLHWSMKFTNANEVSLDKGNGYFGAVDFAPYFTNEFINETPPKFTFTKSMERGDVNDDIGIMQALLVGHGYMAPFKSSEVGFYGPKTQRAVLAFQIDHVPLSWYERNVMQGRVAGPKTISTLNELYF